MVIFADSLKLRYDGKKGGCMTNATWRDVNNVEHTRYMVRAMKPGPGFEIIDTSNHFNWSVLSNFATEADARERMRTKNVEIHGWRRSV